MSIARGKFRDIQVSITTPEGVGCPVDFMFACAKAIQQYEETNQRLIGDPDLDFSDATVIYRGQRNNEVYRATASYDLTNGIYNVVFDAAFASIEDSISPIAEGLTAFQAGELAPAASGNPCLAELTTEFPLTFYHNGEQDNPQIGDTIYTDPQGTTPRTVNFAYGNELGSVGVQVSEFGVSQAYTCR